MAERITRKPAGRKTNVKARPTRVRRPTITSLGRQLEKIKCDHLMGRAVIEQQISDLAVGAMSRSYCQNWTRCPDNGWGLCTPDTEAWLSKLERLGRPDVFTEAELAVINRLKKVPR